VSARTPRKRRAGTGPSAATVITWAMLSDPGLRSAYTLALTRSPETARHRVRTPAPRMCLACLTAAALTAIAIRLVLALV